MSSEILQIMYSDYGKNNTMGIRLYHINNYNNKNYEVICRSSVIPTDNRVKRTPIFVILLGKLISFMMKKINFFRFLKGFDLWLFEKFVVINAPENIKIIHLFNGYPNIIDNAKSKHKIVILEAFTHPLYLAMMFNNGIKFEKKTYTVNKNDIKSYEKADIIISPSSFVTKTLLYANITKEKIIEIPYGVTKQEDKIYNLDKKEIVFLFAGGVKRTKGFEELISAWIESEMSNNHNAKLIICGRLYTASISDTYKKAIKIENINFKGFVKDMSNIYKQADVYIYPTYHEGSSKTVFEAMSYGLPIITTENAGSVVRDKIDGFIVPLNQIQGIVEKIQYFCKDKKQIEIFGKYAQEYSRKFTWELYAKRVNEVYDMAMKNED